MGARAELWKVRAPKLPLALDKRRRDLIDRLRARIGRSNRYKILIALPSAAAQARPITAFLRALAYELREVGGDNVLAVSFLSRRFPLDAAAWQTMLANLPESREKLLGGKPADLLIWSAAGQGDGLTLNFATWPAPAWQEDPQSGALTAANPLAFAPTRQLVPFAATAALAALWPLAREQDKDFAASLDRLYRKMALRLDEQVAHAEAQRAFALRYLFAWAALQACPGTPGSAPCSRAEKIFQDLLQTWPEGGARADYVRICGNLAATRLAMARGGAGSECLERALETITQGLATFARDRAPLRWAAYEKMRGEIHHALGNRHHDDGHLREAVSALKGACLIWRRQHAATRWAQCQTALGNLLHDLGRRESGMASLEQAVLAFRRVLQQSADPLSAGTRYEARLGLSQALLSIAERDGGRRTAREAVNCLRETFAEAPPPGLSKARANLARGLIHLGSVEEDATPIEDAVSLLRNAKREDHRRTLGLALGKLGHMRHDAALLREACETLTACAAPDAEQAKALAALGELTMSPRHLQDAIILFARAVKQTDRETAPRDWALLQRRIALTSLALAKCDVANIAQRFEDAIAAFRLSLTALKRDGAPLLWGRIQAELGETLSLYAASGAGSPRLEQAADAFNKALDSWMPDQPPRERAMTLNALGNVLADLGAQTHSRAKLESARQAYAEAFDIYSANGISELARLAKANLTRAETAIIDLAHRP